LAAVAQAEEQAAADTAAREVAELEKALAASVTTASVDAKARLEAKDGWWEDEKLAACAQATISTNHSEEEEQQGFHRHCEQDLAAGQDWEQEERSASHSETSLDSFQHGAAENETSDAPIRAVRNLIITQKAEEDQGGKTQEEGRCASAYSLFPSRAPSQHQVSMLPVERSGDSAGIDDVCAALTAAGCEALLPNFLEQEIDDFQTLAKMDIKDLLEIGVPSETSKDLLFTISSAVAAMGT